MRKSWSGNAKCLDGVLVAKSIKEKLAAEVAELRKQGIVPGLGTILVGDDPGSKVYVNGKHRDCAEVGIESIRVELPADASEAQILEAIEQLNQDPVCTGYIVQLPLPKGINTNRLLEAMDPEKDADGLHPMNLGRLLLRVNEEINSPLPCTPQACLDILDYYQLDLNGKLVCVIGRGTTVGRTLPALLTRRAVNATVICCHTGTKNTAELAKQADVVICAAGVAGLVTEEMVKPGAIVLDVGVSRGEVNPETGKAALRGDVAEGVDKVAGWLSPNPGGIGPLTRANLLVNVVRMAQRSS